MIDLAAIPDPDLPHPDLDGLTPRQAANNPWHCHACRYLLEGMQQ